MLIREYSSFFSGRKVTIKKCNLYNSLYYIYVTIIKIKKF